MKTRPHKEEMIRFAKSEDGTLVWFRRKSCTSCDTISSPAWHKDSIYILHNKYAVLRKESADTGRPIQVYNYSSLKWETPTHELQFDVDLAFYRLEPKEDHDYIEPKEDHDYIEPIAYYRWERLSSKGEILMSNLISDKYAEKNGYKEDGWIKITNTKRTWEY